MNKEQLKEKVVDYVSKVFFYCVKRCNSRMDAEDLSQTILLEIIQNIDKGARIDNLDYYIWGVCKNQYNMYLRKTIKDRKNIEYKEDIDNADDSKTALDEMLEDEKVKRMNQAIKLLSKDYAEILYAYYVEDKTLKFIAEELNIPLGTVGRRLSGIRQKLKEYLKMERLNGKKAFVPKEYQTHRSGGASLNPEEYVSGLIEQNLLLHSYGNPCSLEDYAIEMGISLPYIENIVNRLEYATLLKKDENNKYLTNFIMVDKNTDIRVLELIKNSAKEYTQLIIEYCKKHFEEWKKLVDNPLLDDNKLMWSYLFSINRKIEYLDCTQEETIKNTRKYGHLFEKGGWDFNMSEVYDSKVNNFRISECIIGNGVIGIQGLFYPGEDNVENIDSEALKCIRWSNSVNWNADFELFGYLLKNKGIKYSDCVYTLKSAVDKMVEENYLKIEDDVIKFNFVLLSFENGKLNKNDDYSKELNPIKLERKKIIKEIKDIFKDVIPEYLYKDLDYIASSYFVVNMKQYVVMAFEEEGLIKPINEKRFVYNMFCWERK